MNLLSQERFLWRLINQRVLVFCRLQSVAFLLLVACVVLLSYLAHRLSVLFTFSDWPSTAKATGRGAASGVLITVEVFGAGSPPPKDIGARVAASGGVRAVEGRGDRWAEGDHNPLSMLLLRSGALQEDATIGTDRIFFLRKNSV